MMYKTIDGHTVSQVVGPRKNDFDSNPQNPHLAFNISIVNGLGDSASWYEELPAGIQLEFWIPGEGWVDDCLEYRKDVFASPFNDWGAYLCDHPDVSPVGLFVRVDGF